MDSLAQTVKDTLSWYVAGGSDHRMYGLADDNEQVYAVIAVGFPVHKRPAMLVVMVRIAGDKVIVEEDRTDRPVVEALARNGIPHEQIFRVGVDEPLPDAEIESVQNG